MLGGDLKIILATDATGKLDITIDPPDSRGIDVYGLMKMAELVMRAQILTGYGDQKRIEAEEKEKKC